VSNELKTIKDRGTSE